MIHTELDESITVTLNRSNAFELSDGAKIKRIEHHFAQIMHTLGLNLYDDSFKTSGKNVCKRGLQQIKPRQQTQNQPI